MSRPKVSMESIEGASPLADTSRDQNFSQLTPLQFGISTQSFMPLSSSSKDKSRLATLKARRRSNIGARGSPETNSLIRYMAQQRAPSLVQTPVPVKGSPFIRGESTLKQKMVSFQNLMDVEECGGCDPVPKTESKTGECIKTRDNLSECESFDSGKENRPTSQTPKPSKRRRVAPPRDCAGEISEAGSPILKHISLNHMKVPCPGPETSICLGTPLCTPRKLQARSLTKTRQEGPFDLGSPSRSLPTDLATRPPGLSALTFSVPSFLPSLLEMNHADQNDSSGHSTVKRKKQVHFGAPLSPEFFDKTLPPCTPLQRGSTPARAATPSLELRSVLKTPQAAENSNQLGGSASSSFGASPTLPMSRNRRLHTMAEDVVEGFEKLAFPSLEEASWSLSDDLEGTCEAPPLNLNKAFQEEESLTETLTGPDVESEAAPAESLGVDAPEKLQLEPPAKAQASSGKQQRKQTPEPSTEAPPDPPAPSTSRKRKQLQESEPVKRSTRSAAKSASRKIKKCCGALRWSGAKPVDRSLYHSRDYASKHPALSPIPESLPSPTRSPVRQPPQLSKHTAAEQEPCLAPLSAREAVGADPVTAMSVVQETDSGLEPSQTVLYASPEPGASDRDGAAANDRWGCLRSSDTGAARRDSGMIVWRRGRRSRKTRVPVSEEPQYRLQGGGDGGKSGNRQTLLELKESVAAPAKLVAANETADHDTLLGGHRDGKAERLDAPTSTCLPAYVEAPDAASVPQDELANQEELAGGDATPDMRARVSSRARRCSLRGKESGRSQSTEEDGLRALGSGSSSGSDGRGEEVVCVASAPWEVEFNFEDVFKPVARRGSVRRSLRHHSSKDHGDGDMGGSGLAWVPRNSPDLAKEVRRKSRRQSAVFTPQCTHQHSTPPIEH